MAAYTLTPARRAALRKAQLASAAKRRKYGVKYQLKRGISQKASLAKANVSLKWKRLHK